MLEAMCRVHLKDGKRTKHLVLMLGLHETVNQMAMASSVCLYVLRSEDGHILRGALDCED